MNNQKEFTLLWYIENFSYCWHPTGDYLASPGFNVYGLNGTKWKLHLYPNGVNDQNRGSVFIELKRVDDNGTGPVGLKGRLSILAEDGSPLFENEFEMGFAEQTSHGWEAAKMDEVLSQENAARLSKDTLTVRCTLLKSEDDAYTYASPLCATTRIEIERISFLHTVEGFSSFKPNQRDARHAFSHTSTGVESCMYLSRCSCCEERVIFAIAPSRKFHFLAKCELHLLEASGRKTKCAEADYRVGAERQRIRKLPLSLTKDAIMERKLEYLPEDALSLICECTLALGIAFKKMERIPNITTMVVKELNKWPFNEPNVFDEELSVCPKALDDLKKV